MKLAELKEEVYESWLFHHSLNDAIAQPEKFKSEIRQYGDLRRKATWIQALCRLEALNIYDSCLDAHKLIAIQFNLSPGSRMYPYRHQLFDEFLAIPEALALLKMGLEQLFSSDFTTEERREARGFFAMVAEQSAGGNVEREPTELSRRIAELTRAATG